MGLGALWWETYGQNVGPRWQTCWKCHVLEWGTGQECQLVFPGLRTLRALPRPLRQHPLSSTIPQCHVERSGSLSAQDAPLWHNLARETGRGRKVPVRPSAARSRPLRKSRIDMIQPMISHLLPVCDWGTSTPILPISPSVPLVNILSVSGGFEHASTVIIALSCLPMPVALFSGISVSPLT